MELPNEIDIVLVYKYDQGDTELFTERVSAVRDGDFYRLIHIPAFAPNLAIGDVVKVEFDGEYYFDELIEESGNSTIHIVIFKPESKEYVAKQLTDFGCGVNIHVAENYIVVNVSPSIPYQPVHDFLMSETEAGNIDFKESCLSKIHMSD